MIRVIICVILLFTVNCKKVEQRKKEKSFIAYYDIFQQGNKIAENIPEEYGSYYGSCAYIKMNYSIKHKKTAVHILKSCIEKNEP